MKPTPEEQVQFLLKIQRLLREGSFSATYKYALLMSIADLSVELGDESGNELSLEADRIAEKFIEYYWRQTLPYLGKGVLRQNTGGPPVVVSRLLRARAECGDSIANVQRDRSRWTNLVGIVSNTVRTMPLNFLQNVGDQPLAFLYDPPRGRAPRTITLYPGVAYCLRQFHGLIIEPVQGAWAKWVQRQNISVIGDQGDLHEFLFGAKRGSLIRLQDPLRQLQQNQCFYCSKEMRTKSDVDHFIPWTLYQFDLGHNFVLAHPTCNSQKRDRIASESHLRTWVNRNRLFGTALGEEFDQIGIPHNLAATLRIARWAYGSNSSMNGLTWVNGNELTPLCAAELRQRLAIASVLLIAVRTRRLGVSPRSDTSALQVVLTSRFPGCPGHQDGDYPSTCQKNVAIF